MYPCVSTHNIYDIYIYIYTYSNHYIYIYIYTYLYTHTHTYYTQEHHSAALAQLASRINAVMKFGSSAGEDRVMNIGYFYYYLQLFVVSYYLLSLRYDIAFGYYYYYYYYLSEDPFTKVKGLISDMIAKLESEENVSITHIPNK